MMLKMTKPTNWTNMELPKEIILRLDQFKSEYQDLIRRYDSYVTGLQLKDNERDQIIDYIFNNLGELENKS